MKGRSFKQSFLCCLVISMFLIVVQTQNITIDSSMQTCNNINSFPLNSCDWNPPINKPVGDTPIGVFIGDVNNDGQNDIVIAESGNSSINILLWNSSSHDWDIQIRKYGFSHVIAVFIGDANNDGYNDIATANTFDNSVSILCWNSSLGDWDSAINKPVGGWPYGVHIGDANNDGKNDIVTADYSSGTISILLWNIGFSNWNPSINRSVGGQPQNAFIGDANNDGYNDIVSESELDGTISIFLWNTTSNDWDTRITKSVGVQPYRVFVEDANNDGYNDIISTDDLTNVSIFLWNETAGDWNPRIPRIAGSYIPYIYVDDVNNDGKNDIVATGWMSNVTITLWNTTSEDWDTPLSMLAGYMPSGLCIGDADNDGQNDIVVTNYGDNTVSIILGKFPPRNVILNPILPQIDFNGVILLNWTDEATTNNYYVYRNKSIITSTNGLIPIAEVSESNYTDIITKNGIYYYAIVAENAYGNSTISNCENVTVAIPPSAPGLNPITPRADPDGVITLDWSAVSSATKYYIYRNTSVITAVTQLIPIHVTAADNYTDIISANGIYYYVIVAGDEYINGSVSNCENVTVTNPLIAPQLETITPNPNTNGIINLKWNDVTKAIIYSVYRNTSLITSIAELTPIARVSLSEYTDIINIPGNYYYVIIASDGWVNSTISQCKDVQFIPSEDKGIPGFEFFIVIFGLGIWIAAYLRKKTTFRFLNSLTLFSLKTMESHLR